ncbi:MAG TPA: plastocyanin/azurin family copper-binding protein [Solirubrobacterales bacterium]|nr:plastocyanin/azurin family copper-binding protein [Solirubrobacterales bacterium]
MSNETFFFVCGIALAVSAVTTSFLGLRIKGFPGRAAPLIALWFILLVGASMTFAVLHAQDEEDAKAAELTTAGEEITQEESSPVPAESEKAPAPKSQPAAKGPGGTLQLAASPTQIAFDTTTLSSKPGKVTIDFNNPSALEHDVAIEQSGEVIAESELIAEGKTSVTANLAPGTYTYLCTVPGHAEAGMEGVLTVR